MAKPRYPVERIALPISPRQIDRIEDFRFAKRIPSRAAAIRALIDIGLDHPDDYGKPALRSKTSKG